MPRYLPSLLCLSLFVLSVSAGYAFFSRSQAQTRGLDLGAPLNRPFNLYGLNVELLESPDRDEQLAALKESGFGWIRQRFDWQKTDWAQADSLAAATRANGLGLAAVLEGERPPDPVAFASFAREFAARYQESIDYYQIWDEPNLELGWSGPPNPAEYARLLQAAHTAVHAADPTAVVLLAGLAPTIETGPKNISDILYLRQLYELGAAPYFEAVAGKPYGFNTSPTDRTLDRNTLNFSRLILLREEMLAHGDGNKFVWSSNFGWNTRASIWGQVTPEAQVEYTRGAYQRALNEWLWAGPLFLETPRPGAAPGDPHNGFAMGSSEQLSVSSEQLSAIPLRFAPGTIASNQLSMLPGVYAAQGLNAYAIFDGDWKFSDLGADIPQNGPATITFNFIGTELAITVRRADYRAYLYVTIDGSPANAPPKDAEGNAYVVLTSLDLQPRLDTLPLASGLPPGSHTAVIRAERGWDQWAIVAFKVGPNVNRPDARWPLILLSLTALAALIGAIVFFPRSPLAAPAEPQASTLNDLTQTLLAAFISAILWASAWLTWGNNLANTSPSGRYSDSVSLLLTLLTAGLLYYSPFLILTLLSILALFILFYLRPTLALPLIAFFAPFYLLPRPLWDRAFSMVEICTVLAAAATALRYIPAAVNSVRQTIVSPQKREDREGFYINPSWHLRGETILDLVVIAFAFIAALTIPFAELRGVAFREFRVVVIESVMFYGLLRIHLSPSPEGARLIWRIVDFFLLGAVIVALYGLSNLITGDNLITAEGGIARIRSVYGSPNNLGLYLGRVIPVAAAVVLLGNQRVRRFWYGLALLPLLAAAVFSFSRGALLLGIPAALAVILLFWGGRRAAISLAGLGLAGVIAFALLSSNPRFANLFSISSGTGFFRVNVWRSAWAMFSDHPILGVGLDNFLYAYRGKYIQPEAWEEPNLPHAHNIFLDALTRTGLPGLFALLAMLGAFFKLAFDVLRSPGLTPDLRALAIGLLASMVNFAAHGLVDTGYWFVDLAFVFMMTLGLMAGISRSAKSKLSDEPVKDDQIDTSNIPPLTDKFFKTAKWRTPKP